MEEEQLRKKNCDGKIEVMFRVGIASAKNQASTQKNGDKTVRAHIARNDSSNNDKNVTDRMG